MNTLKNKLINIVADYNNGVIDADNLESLVIQANTESGDTWYLISYDARGRAALRHYLKDAK